MATKVNEQNWPQLDFLINNFYEIVEYKRGRGVYGDRVVLKRPLHAKSIVGETDKMYEFYYLDANAVKELPRTTLEKIKVICKLVVSPENMNILCNFDNPNGEEPNEWAITTAKALADAKTIDFEKLNNVLVERYKLLDSEFLSMLNKHREKQYFLASSGEFNFVTKEYADKQMARL